MPRVTEGKSERLEMPAPCPDQTAALSPAGASEHLPHLLPQEEEEALWSVGEANTAIHRGGVSHARGQEAHRGVDAVQRENGHSPSGRWGNAEVGVPRGSHGYPREGQKGCLPGRHGKPRPGKSTQPLSTTPPAERLDPGVQDPQGAKQVSWEALGEREPVGGDHVGRPHGRPFILIFSYVSPSLIKCIITYLV